MAPTGAHGFFAAQTLSRIVFSHCSMPSRLMSFIRGGGGEGGDGGGEGGGAAKVGNKTSVGIEKPSSAPESQAATTIAPSARLGSSLRVNAIWVG